MTTTSAPEVDLVDVETEPVEIRRNGLLAGGIGGVATIVYVASNLFTVDRPTAAAMIYAVSGILGTVLIAGGVFLLHRKDAHAFFTR